jgi:hypothetical protein
VRELGGRTQGEGRKGDGDEGPDCSERFADGDVAVVHSERDGEVDVEVALAADDIDPRLLDLVGEMVEPARTDDLDSNGNGDLQPKMKMVRRGWIAKRRGTNQRDTSSTEAEALEDPEEGCGEGCEWRIERVEGDQGYEPM